MLLLHSLPVQVADRPVRLPGAAALLAGIAAIEIARAGLTPSDGAAPTFHGADAILLAVLLVSRAANWPAWLLLGVAAHAGIDMALGVPWPLAAGLSCAGGAACAIAAGLLRRSLPDPCDLVLPGVAFRILLGAGWIAGATTAVVMAALAQGPATIVQAAEQLVAGLVSIVVITPPALLILSGRIVVLAARLARPAAAAMIGITLAVTLGVFLQSQYPLLFLAFGAMTLQFGTLGIAGVVVTLPFVAGIALWSTGRGQGPFALTPEAGADSRMLFAYAFIAILAAVAYRMAQVVGARERSVRALATESGRLRNTMAALSESQREQQARTTELQRANDRADMALESAEMGIWDFDIARNRLAWQAQTYRLHGLEAEAAEDTLARWADCIHPADRVAARDELDACSAGGADVNGTYRVIWPDGTTHHLRSRGRLTRDAAGRPLSVSGMTWDVTAGRLLEEQREVMVEAAPNGMMTVDAQGRIVMANAALERIFGYARGALAGRPVDVLDSAPATASAGGLSTALSGEDPDATAPSGREVVGRRQDGSILAIEVMWNAVAAQERRLVVASLFDVTARRLEQVRQQEALQRQQREVQAANASLERLSRHLAQARDRAEEASQAKTRFLAAITHELRTPLHGILGYASLLTIDGELSPRQSARLEAMVHAGRHLLDTINSVLDFSQIEADQIVLQQDHVALADLVDHCLAVVRPSAELKGLELLSDVPAALALRTDPTRLRQVLVNLLGNAIKFTPSGSVALRAAACTESGTLRIEVIDTGPGIRAQHRDKLFQSFERLNAQAVSGVEGTGLGLAIAGRLVTLLGGRIGQADNPQGGSIFWLDLPREAVAAAPAARAAVEPRADPDRPLRVLVADDESLNRSIAAAFLGLAGHAVETVDDGESAVEAATAGDFDVILMDVRMPGLNGLEATRRIRRLPGRRGAVRIIAVTAQAFTQQIAECRAAGMDGHLSKPFDRDALLAALRAGVGEPAPAPIPWAAEGREAESDVFDRPLFDELASTLPASEIADHLYVLRSRCQSMVTNLREPNPSGDVSWLVDHAHRLAGGAGTFGFHGICDAARLYEAAAEAAPGTPAAAAAASRLIGAIDAAMPLLQRQLAGATKAIA